MKLQEFLNKFTNDYFLLSVNGLCDELYFWEYEEMKLDDYWKDYKNKKIKGISILMTNDMPELCIEIEE